MKRPVIKLLLLLLSMLMLTQCGSISGESTGLKGEVRIDGSSTVYPISEAIAEEFLYEQPRVKITVGISGTGGGFKKFIRREIDINNASRKIKEAEHKACIDNDIAYIELMVAFDGLVVVVNKKNDWVDHFTVEELRKIWEPAAQNKVVRWNQIRSEWPDEAFHLYGPGIASGSYDYFTEALIGQSGASRGDFTASEDDNVLVKGIAGDKNAIGFFGFAYYEENRDKLKVIGVDDGNGVIIPGLETIKSGVYSPLSRPVFIYVNDQAAGRPAVREFVNFYLNNADSLVRETGYIPLPGEEYENQINAFSTFFNPS